MGFVLAYCIIVTAPVPWFEGLGIGDRACQFVKDHDRSYFFPSNKFLNLPFLANFYEITKMSGPTTF